MFVDNRFRIKM